MSFCGFCCCDGEEGGEESPFPRDVEEGEKKERGCTDKGCLFLFALFIAGMAAEVAWSIYRGSQPRRLTHGVDYRGNICGVDVPEQWVYWCGSVARTGPLPDRILHESTVCLQSCPQNDSLRIKCLMPAFHNATSTPGGNLFLPNGNGYVAVPNKVTLHMTIVQSVVNQPSYPTEPYAGKFCMPARYANSTLRDEIINGPYAWRYRAGAAFGSLQKAAPLLIGVALMAVILGYIYVLILAHCAGVLIFGVMCLSVALVFSSGVFFLFALFVSGEDEHSFYEVTNPIFRTYIGWEARWFSIVTGTFLVMASACLGTVTYKTYEQIDEAIGIVQASIECLGQEGSLKLFPLLQSLAIISLIGVFLFFGLPWVAALGYQEPGDISINGEMIDSLYRIYRRTWLDRFFIFYYLVGCWWITEFFICFGQMVVSYAVCLWYFQEVEEEEGEGGFPTELKEIVKGKQVKVRVSGIDDFYLPRQGVVARYGKGKYLMVPVDEEDKEFGPEDLNEVDFVKQPVACAVTKGICVVFWNHMGSIAVGCLLIAVCRPFRMFSACLSGFVREKEGEESDSDSDEGESKGEGGEEKPPDDSSLCSFDNWKTLCSYVGACMDTVFGGYTKNTFTEIVLSASHFMEAAEVALEFMEEAGGTVAFLMGACYVYEVFGTLCITLICVIAFVVSATRMDTFADPASSWYIPSLYWGTLYATIIAGVTSFEFMQIFSHTADSLLYAFAWNRQLMAAEPNFATTKYCPGSLRDMMPEFELEPGGELECSDAKPSDFIARAAWDHAWRRWNSRKTPESRSTSRVSTSRRSGSASSGTMFAPSTPSGRSRRGSGRSLGKIDEEGEEAPLMTPGRDDARELSFR